MSFHPFWKFFTELNCLRNYGWLLCCVVFLSCEDASKVEPILWRPVDDLNFFLIDDSFFTRIAEESNASFASVVPIRRNSMGDALFLTGQRQEPSGVLRADSPGAFTYRAFDPQDIIDGDFNRVASYSKSDGGYVFPNGEIISRPKFGRFKVDLSGTYYLVSTREGTTKIASVEAPEETLIERDERLEWIFYSPEGGLHLFSRVYKNKTVTGVLWLQYRQTENAFTLNKEIVIPRKRAGHSPYVVVDCEPVKGVVVLEDVRDPPFDGWTAYYSFDSASQRLLKLARTKKRWKHGFFLNEEFAANLHSAFGQESGMSNSPTTTPAVQ